MAKKLSPFRQQRQLARAKAVLVSMFFPRGLPPEGPLAELLRYWGFHEGVNFHADKMHARLKQLTQDRALKIIPPLPRRWELQGGNYAIRTSTTGGCQDISAWRYAILKPDPAFGSTKPAPSVPAAPPPESPQPDTTATPEISQPKISPKAWFANALTTYPQHPGEKTGTYAKRLYARMQADAATLTKLWERRTFNRRINEALPGRTRPAQGKV